MFSKSHGGPGHRYAHHHGPRPEHGDGPHSHHRGPRGRRGRAGRGDVRAAVIAVLADEPMHGYQLMQAITDRTDGRWTPSPGAIYPTISQLEDEGLVTVTADGGRKLVALTDAGREQAESLRTDGKDPFDIDGAGSGELMRLVMQVAGASREVARSGSDGQVGAAADILRAARRSLYLLLAEDDAPARS
jgi:DNA-binding PadR family transcriptional regulator